MIKIDFPAILLEIEVRFIYENYDLRIIKHKFCANKLVEKTVNPCIKLPVIGKTSKFTLYMSCSVDSYTLV